MKVSQQQIHQPLTQEMKNQLNRFFKAQEEKHIANFENEMMSMVEELNKLKNIIALNELEIKKQNGQIEDFKQKIGLIQTKTENKVIALSKQLHSFKDYYSHCFQYTMQRVNEVEAIARIVTQQVIKLTKNEVTLQIGDYVKYVNEKVIKILTSNSLRNQQFQFNIHEELFELEIKTGNFLQLFNSFQLRVDELNALHFGNESLTQAILSSSKNIERIKQDYMKSDSKVGKKLLNYFEPKFKDIMKQMNAFSLQAQMIKVIEAHENEQSISINSQKEQYLQNLQTQISNLKAVIEEDKNCFQKQMGKKEETLVKRHQRILQLEQQLSNLLGQYNKSTAQILQLKYQISALMQENKVLADNEMKKNLKIAQLQNELEVQKNENFGSRTKLTNDKDESNLKTNSESIILETVNDKMLMSSNLNRSKRSNQRMLSHSSHKNTYSLAVIQSSDAKCNSKLEENKLLKNQIFALEKSKSQLMKTNKDLQKYISFLLNEKSKQNQEDIKYMDTIETQIERNALEIEKLEIQNEELKWKIMEANKKYEQLEQSYEEVSNNLQNLIIENKAIYCQLEKFNSFSNQSPRKNANKNGTVLKVVNERKKLRESFVDCQNNRESQEIIIELKNAIDALRLPTPIFCEVDENNFLREHSTNRYLVDSSRTPFCLSQAQIQLATQSGLILI